MLHITGIRMYMCIDKTDFDDGYTQVKSILDEFLEKLPEEFNMMELFARAEEKTPYVLVALQECERMNGLTREMKRSLREVDLGLKVHTINTHNTSAYCVEDIQSLFVNAIYRVN